MQIFSDESTAHNLHSRHYSDDEANLHSRYTLLLCFEGVEGRHLRERTVRKELNQAQNAHKALLDRSLLLLLTRLSFLLRKVRVYLSLGMIFDFVLFVFLMAVDFVDLDLIVVVKLHCPFLLERAVSIDT